jgi:hypothetical protein
MAIYKIFPEKSATLYSFYPTINTGLDEILEISTFTSINDTNEVSRAIINFPTDEINDIINNKVSGSRYDTYLKLYLANASSLPVNYTLYCNPISGSWESGTGRLSNVPVTTDGASWGDRDQLDGVNWFNNTTFPALTTGSFRSGSNSGGGLWYTGSYEATQSFTNSTSKDIELKTTYTVDKWYSGSIINNGFIIKHSPITEFTSQSKFETKYFSGNTHTIYPPCLEIRWDDSSYVTGSLSIITSDKIIANFINNKDKYQQGSIQRFRINVRDQFPARSFQTSSVYLNNKLLPATSYWSIKDLDTEEIVIDYDTLYTKISADSSGNYFDLYMNGLEPERNYQVLIKTIIGNSTLILDNNYYFKVIR